MEQEIDYDLQRLVSELEEQYAYLRNTVQKNYVYHRSPAHMKAFTKAARFCRENGLTAEEYSMALLDSLGDHRENFYPSYFGSGTANQAALNYREDRAIPLDLIYEQQKELLRIQIQKLGRNYLDVLMDPRLKFYAWFRIIASKNPEHEVIQVYGKTAKAELTPGLVEFLRNQNVDIERIYG
jgi:hypothetical protein